MNIPLYAAVSVLIMMVWHFMFSTNPRDFGLMQMAGVFVIAGAVGYYMQSTETAIFLSLILSVIFI